MGAGDRTSSGCSNTVRMRCCGRLMIWWTGREAAGKRIEAQECAPDRTERWALTAQRVPNKPAGLRVAAAVPAVKHEPGHVPPPPPGAHPL